MARNEKDPWKDVRFESGRDRRPEGGAGTFLLVLVGCILGGALIGAVAGWFAFAEYIDPFRRTYEAEMMTTEELKARGVHWFLAGGALLGGIGGAQLARQCWPRK